MESTSPLAVEHPTALSQGIAGAFETLDRIESLTETLRDGELRRAISSKGRLNEPRLLHAITACLELQDDPAQICREILQQLAGCIPCQAMMIQLNCIDIDCSGGLVEQIGKQYSLDRWNEVAEKSQTNQHRYVLNRPIRHRTSTLGRLISVRDQSMIPFDAEETDWIESVLSVLAMHLVNQRQFVEMQAILQGTVHSLVAALEAKDSYTNGHSSRVANLATELAQRLGMSGEAIAGLKLAGVLHDIGKIGIDDSVLRKPGALSAAEFDQIKRHPVLGYEILKDIRPFRHILPAVRHHHESWDGAGYPDGLAGNAIPRDAQILAVADAFDAMVSDRPYRRGLPLAKVREIFQKGRGQQWASDVVDILLSSEDLLQRYFPGSEDFQTNPSFPSNSATEVPFPTNGEYSDSSITSTVSDRR